MTRLRAAKWLMAVGLTRTAASALSFCAIAYCAFTGQWLPAIFILLARSEFVKWLDGIAEQLSARIAALKANPG